MKQHAFDATSFIFGVVLGAAGIGFLLAEQYEWNIDGRWVLPAALIALGVAGIAGAISGLVPRRESGGDDYTEADSDDVPATAIDGRDAITKQ